LTTLEKVAAALALVSVMAGALSVVVRYYAERQEAKTT
jgi:hypothetical protein